MPVSRGRLPAETDPPALRPYAFHGCDLARRGDHACGDCPFCGGAGKLSVDCESGLWRCWTCGGGRDGGGGNALVFIRLLHAAARRSTPAGAHELLARARRLADPRTPEAWGCALSPMPGRAWLVPGYGPDGQLWQLYRWSQSRGRWLLLATPGIHPEGRQHGLHMPVEDYDPGRPRWVVCEGPWDGMAWWEAGRVDDVNVVAAPGCNVWRDEWSAMCRNKAVTLAYDSDHPREMHGKVYRAGWDGMKRVARRLDGSAREIGVLRWGPDGYDPALPDGWDVRDALSGAPGPALPIHERPRCLALLSSKVGPAPPEWFGALVGDGGRGPAFSGEARECSTWERCATSWDLRRGGALEWRQEMGDALAVILAVCASTQQAGNQLFVQLIGSAGSGKTTMCDGLLVSRHCHHLEHLTGFHSGWKKKDDNGKDCSLIARINGKTLVTPEADVLMTSPQFHQIMAQQRRIFDGKSGATFRNSDEDRVYVGLRTPWIMAGTPAMMDHDQSHLGDRFLRFIIEDPPELQKQAILRSAVRNERTAMLERSNGTPGSIVDPRLRLAHALTGGYVDWLRAHVEEKLSQVDVPASAEDQCIRLAELSADLRARPNDDKSKNEPHECKELPTRLVRQNIRLACCLAVVLNKRVVDADVLRIVRKVALDTAAGHSLNIVKWMCSRAPRGEDGETYQDCGGIMEGLLQVWTGMTRDRLEKYLNFLRKIEVLDWRRVPQSSGAWMLTGRVYNLFQQIMRD